MKKDDYYIAGVDEAGRGPLAGPVIAAAVILDPKQPIMGIKDSKQLSAKKRQSLFVAICNKALAYGVGRAKVDEIDRLNILGASLLAMQRAVTNLTITPDKVLVDGKHCPQVCAAVEAIIGGDQTVLAISTASIIAKVVRDNEMMDLNQQFPGYGFAKHKGYPTKAHLSALARLGVCPIHRRSFAPVRKILANWTYAKR